MIAKILWFQNYQAKARERAKAHTHSTSITKRSRSASLHDFSTVSLSLHDCCTVAKTVIRKKIQGGPLANVSLSTNANMCKSDTC